MNAEYAHAPIRDIVVRDYRTAAVFQKFGLDFCCGGGVSIDEACRRKNIDSAQVVAEVDSVLASGGSDEPYVNDWEFCTSLYTLDLSFCL